MTVRSGPGSPSAVVLGRVGAPHGVQGWVKVTSYTEPAAGIADYPQWTLVHGHQSRPVRILGSKRAGQNLAVRLEGIDTMDAARMLTGAPTTIRPLRCIWRLRGPILTKPRPRRAAG